MFSAQGEYWVVYHSCRREPDCPSNSLPKEILTFFSFRRCFFRLFRRCLLRLLWRCLLRLFRNLRFFFANHVTHLLSQVIKLTFNIIRTYNRTLSIILTKITLVNIFFSPNRPSDYSSLCKHLLRHEGLTRASQFAYSSKFVYSSPSLSPLLSGLLGSKPLSLSHWSGMPLRSVSKRAVPAARLGYRSTTEWSWKDTYEELKVKY